ncbi:hypothetical protein K435DRAFT_929252 [Dendrothele bispora CBS 962.96]|uniref:Protein kinase domain-containing protein n=1 Tax=Dendrothele bispora (strain CBS 962.96) TaxID=1314807 RepID=A0A4S8L5R0_DENBC|nr:hypothetical protein K435DRAFT_929252 [Dendrothele bispora CBS 962.96]
MPDLFEWRYVLETEVSYTPGHGLYHPGSNWQALLRTLHQSTGTPTTLQDMTVDPLVAAAALSLVVLERPFQCTNEEGELLGALDADQIRQLSTAPRQGFQDVSSLPNLDHIIVEEDQGPPYTTRYLISRKIQRPTDELDRLLTIFVPEIPPVWNLGIIKSNSIYLEGDPPGHEELLAPIKSYRKRLLEKRIVPKSLHCSSSPKQRNIYQAIKAYVPEGPWNEYYEEEPNLDQEIADDGHGGDAGPAPSPSLDLKHVSFEELVGILDLMVLLRPIIEFHRENYSQSSSIRTTNFCQLFPSLPLAVDWVAKDKRPRYSYMEGQQSGLSGFLQASHLAKSLLFNPKPDFHLQNGFLSPLIGEVDSNIEEQDKFRMLANSIILSRIGTWAFPEGVPRDSKNSDKGEPFIVLAMFVSKLMVVDMYWTYTPYGSETVILNETLDLENVGVAVLLNVMLFNLREQWTRVPSMDPKLQQKLEGFKRDMKDSSKKKRKDPGFDRDEGSSSDSSRKKTSSDSQSNDKGSSSGRTRGLGPDQLYNAQAEGSQTPVDDFLPTENWFTLYSFPSPFAPRPTTYSLQAMPPPTHTRILSAHEGAFLASLADHVKLDNTEFLTCAFLHLPIYGVERVNDKYQGTYSDAVVTIEDDHFRGKELETAIQILDCVCVLHTLAVVHLDIHLSNFVWDQNSSLVKLSHFALARSCPDTKAKTSGPIGLLKPPEYTNSSSVYNPYRVDNFATALVVLGLLTSVIPNAPEDLADPMQFLAEKASCMISDRTEPKQVLQEFRMQYGHDRFGIKPRPSLGATSSSWFDSQGLSD